MLEHGQRHPQRLTEILECFIVSSVAKYCLVLSQYDLHHGSFLLVTPIVMSSYKSIKLLIVKAPSFGGMLYSVSLVQSKENSRQNPGQNILERHLRVTHAVTDVAEQQGRTAHLPPLATCPEAVTQKVKFPQSSPKSLLRSLIQDILLRQRRKMVFCVIIECYARGRVLFLQGKL